MQVTYDLVVDFARPNKSDTIIISEGDNNSRVCHFTLLNNRNPFSMSDVTVATVRGVKKDGSEIFGDATILEDEDGNKINEIEYTIPSAMTSVAGDITMTITLNSESNEQITSFEFYVLVRNALYNEESFVSESDLSGFRDIMNRCLIAIEKVEAMTENTALPNPYPINIDIGSEVISYDGSEQVTIDLSDVVKIV